MEHVRTITDGRRRIRWEWWELSGLYVCSTPHGDAFVKPAEIDDDGKPKSGPYTPMVAAWQIMESGESELSLEWEGDPKDELRLAKIVAMAALRYSLRDVIERLEFIRECSDF